MLPPIHSCYALTPLIPPTHSPTTHPQRGVHTPALAPPVPGDPEDSPLLGPTRLMVFLSGAPDLGPGKTVITAATGRRSNGGQAAGGGGGAQVSCGLGPARPCCSNMQTCGMGVFGCAAACKVA
jgi:hypothetical protein